MLIDKHRAYLLVFLHTRGLPQVLFRQPQVALLASALALNLVPAQPQPQFAQLVPWRVRLDTFDQRASVVLRRSERVSDESVQPADAQRSVGLARFG